MSVTSTFRCASEEALRPNSRRCTSQCPSCLTQFGAPLIRRNLELEQQIIRQATAGAVDPERLIEHCQNRAQTLSGEYVRNPLDILPGRNRILDGREEACDGVNHCTFLLQASDWDDTEQRDDVLIAIRFFALAYERLRKLEESG